MADFRKIQDEFVQSIRNPDQTQFDYGIEPRRMKIYQELFFNNVKGFIDSGFPVLHSLYSQTDWDILIRKFFASHSCRSPFFIDISKEFVEYLSNQYELLDTDPVFLKELAHYEWLELDVSVRKTEQQASFFKGPDLPDCVVMSDLATLVSYPFNVHQISADYIPIEAGEMVYIVVYRDAQQEVCFFVGNAVTAHLLQLIEQHHTGVSVSQLVNEMCEALPQLSKQQVEIGLHDTIKQLLRKHVLLIPQD